MLVDWQLDLGRERRPAGDRCRATNRPVSGQLGIRTRRPAVSRQDDPASIARAGRRRSRTRPAGGPIPAWYGYTHHLVSKSQYSELVTVVILSAFIFTPIAQQLFQPAVIDEETDRLTTTATVCA